MYFILHSCNEIGKKSPTRTDSGVGQTLTEISLLYKQSKMSRGVFTAHLMQQSETSRCGNAQDVTFG
jgi:hypothetical protein